MGPAVPRDQIDLSKPDVKWTKCYENGRERWKPVKKLGPQDRLCGIQEYDYGDYDPAIHEYGPGEAEFIRLIQPREILDQQGEVDSIMHLIQDEEVTAELHHLGLPPDEYYDELRRLWGLWWPEADPKLLDCLLYTSPSPRDATLSRMPSSA